MPMSRRLFAATAVTALLLDSSPVMAQTPGASPEPLPPEVIFETLLATPFSSPLLPADAGEIVVTEWVDSGDSDLEGAIGGLLFGGPGDGDEAGIGAMIVLPKIDMARERVTRVPEIGALGETVRPLEIAGYAGTTIVFPGSTNDIPEEGYAVSAIAAGPVIISGGSERLPDNELEARSLANLVALIDHYRRVIS